MRNALEIAIELSNIVQAKFERTGEDYKDLIEEEKKECLGVDQNNQSTRKNKFENIITQEER